MRKVKLSRIEKFQSDCSRLGVTDIVIKYENRKLYSTISSGYVTLSYIYDLWRIGKRVQVTGPDGEDISDSILLEAIFFRHKRDTRFLQHVLDFLPEDR